MIVEGDNKQEKEEDPPATNGLDDTKEKKDDDKSVSVENKGGNLGGDSETLTEAQIKLFEVTRLKDEAEEKIKILSKEKEDAIKSLEIEVFKLKEELQKKS